MNRDDIPSNLDECIKFFETFVPKEELDYIANKAPGKPCRETDMIQFHHTTGRAIRNDWGLWSDSELKRWFNDLGIEHPDDMSGIIMTSLWRHMNGKPIDLEKQVEHYKAYWREHGDASVRG